MVGKVGVGKPVRLRVGILDGVLAVLFFVSGLMTLLAHESPMFRDAVCEGVSALCFRSEHHEAWNKLMYDVSMGSVLSLIFYALIVRLPEAQRKTRLKRSFRLQYESFKLACIENFLVLTGGDTSTENQRRLLDLDAFKTYFKEPAGVGQDRWHAVANAMNEFYMIDIVTRLDAVRDEALFLLNNVDIDDPAVVDFFKNMAVVVKLTARQSTLTEYDAVKRLMGILWPIFTSWSWVEGYRGYDPIERMIDAA